MAKTEYALRGELPGVLGVSRSRAYTLSHRPDFPKPSIHTTQGRRLWRVATVLSWNRKRLARNG